MRRDNLRRVHIESSNRETQTASEIGVGLAQEGELTAPRIGLSYQGIRDALSMQVVFYLVIVFLHYPLNNHPMAAAMEKIPMASAEECQREADRISTYESYSAFCVRGVAP